jgi:hypothetical protein
MAQIGADGISFFELRTSVTSVDKNSVHWRDLYSYSAFPDLRLMNASTHLFTTGRGPNSTTFFWESWVWVFAATTYRGGRGIVEMGEREGRKMMACEEAKRTR